MLFVHDFSEVLKHKSEAFEMFNKFKVFVKNQSGLKIKALRTDRGGEFTSNEFDEFCQLNEIRRPSTLPISLQQNGASEEESYCSRDGTKKAEK